MQADPDLAGALPPDSKFEQLAPSRKRLLDTVKMIAYRAETAMVGIVRETLRRADDGRSLKIGRASCRERV